MNLATSCGASCTRIEARKAQILVEIAQHRREWQCLYAERIGPFDQRIPRAVTRRVVIAHDIEPA